MADNGPIQSDNNQTFSVFIFVYEKHKFQTVLKKSVKDNEVQNSAKDRCQQFREFIICVLEVGLQN